MVSKFFEIRLRLQDLGHKFEQIALLLLESMLQLLVHHEFAALCVLDIFSFTLNFVLDILPYFDPLPQSHVVSFQSVRPET